MKKILIAISLIILIIMRCNAQVLSNIPQATLMAAQEAVREQQKPASEVVRVGIGSNNFGTYQFNEIIIFGTGDTQVFDK